MYWNIVLNVFKCIFEYYINVFKCIFEYYINVFKCIFEYYINVFKCIFEYSKKATYIRTSTTDHILILDRNR